MAGSAAISTPIVTRFLWSAEMPSEALLPITTLACFCRPSILRRLRAYFNLSSRGIEAGKRHYVKIEAEIGMEFDKAAHSIRK